MPTLLYALLACDGAVVPDDDTSTPGPDLDPATVPLAGSCAMDVDYGGFKVEVFEDGSNVEGAVADGVVPWTVLEELVAEGDCAVLRRNNPFCDPACGMDETCDFEGECLPYPESQDLGTVTIQGLADTVAMEPVFPGNTYYDTDLVHPVFVPGEVVTLSMPGGAYGPLELHGVGVEDLDLDGAEWVLEEGVDLTLTWPAPTSSVVRSEIAVQISIDQHGVTPSVLSCVFDDDGEGVVPGAVLDALVDVGVTGFPSGAMQRRTADRGAAGGGCMDFTVSSPRTVAVDVVGHTPCVSDGECPEGQTCNEELQICE